MVIIGSPLPQNNGNLPLPFFGGIFPVVLLHIYYKLLHMYVKWFTWMIFYHDRICYMEEMGVIIIIQLSQ